jgi:hypothetical protein
MLKMLHLPPQYAPCWQHGDLHGWRLGPFLHSILIRPALASRHFLSEATTVDIAFILLILVLYAMTHWIVAGIQQLLGLGK